VVNAGGPCERAGGQSDGSSRIIALKVIFNKNSRFMCGDVHGPIGQAGPD
jgi:hypothetical protein